jgi:hypothetical protein
MPKNTTRKPEDNPLGPDAKQHRAPVSERVAYALSLVDAPEVKPYRDRQAAIAKRFRVSMSTAAEDIKRAAAIIDQRIRDIAPHAAGLAWAGMERVTLKAEKAGKFEVALTGWWRIWQIASGSTEESQARKLTDAALDAAIRQAAAAHVERMTPTELEDLLRRKQEDQAPPAQAPKGETP